MKEKLYTIPLNDAMNAHDECPFCFIERSLEQDMLDFALGACASYMESDVRDMTDKEGFCRMHFKKMFDYGNTLGNGWILKTHYMRLIKEMKQEFKSYSPLKITFKDKLKRTEFTNPIGVWAIEKSKSCYICKRYDETYERYMDTFFYLYKKDEEFITKLKESKGFCLPHFGDVMNAAENKLNDKEKQEFFPLVFDLMEKNMQRLTDDVSWLVEKFDYRNADADWKTSKDAVQRGMQKLTGGYPADPAYKMNK